MKLWNLLNLYGVPIFFWVTVYVFWHINTIILKFVSHLLQFNGGCLKLIFEASICIKILNCMYKTFFCIYYFNKGFQFCLVSEIFCNFLVNSEHRIENEIIHITKQSINISIFFWGISMHILVFLVLL